MIVLSCIDAADTDVYVQAAAVSHYLHGILYIKRRMKYFLAEAFAKMNTSANALFNSMSLLVVTQIVTFMAMEKQVTMIT